MSRDSTACEIVAEYAIRNVGNLQGVVAIKQAMYIAVDIVF